MCQEIQRLTYTTEFLISPQETTFPSQLNSILLVAQAKKPWGHLWLISLLYAMFMVSISRLSSTLTMCLEPCYFSVSPLYTLAKAAMVCAERASALSPCQSFLEWSPSDTCMLTPSHFSSLLSEAFPDLLPIPAIPLICFIFPLALISMKHALYSTDWSCLLWTPCRQEFLLLCAAGNLIF